VTKPGHTVEYIKGEKTYIPKRRTGNRQWTEAYWEPGQVTGVKIDGKYFSLDKSNHKHYSNVMKRVDTALKDVQTRVDTSAPPTFQFGVDTSRLDTPLLSGNQDIGALIKTHLSNLQQSPEGDPGSSTDTPNPQVPDANTDDPYPQDPGGSGDGGDYPGSDVPYDPSTDYPQEPPGDVN
ncbi:MAG: hypothetical protein GY928_19980, partial [Colwellia sp.]|nr:hypothetical protein [Colwellia sp.]